MMGIVHLINDITLTDGLALLSILVVIGGAAMATARAHINRRVEVEVDKRVHEEVDERLAPYLDALRAIPHIREDLASLKTKVENGLTDRQKRMEDKIDAIILHNNTVMRKDVP